MREALPLFLFFLSLLFLLVLEPETVQIREVDTYGKVYRVCGVLFPVKELERGCIYTLSDGEIEMKAVAFFGRCMAGYVCMYVRLEEYRGEPELVILEYA